MTTRTTDEPLARPRRTAARGWLYRAAALLGIACACYWLPGHFLRGDAAMFDQGDAAQHISGWRFYRADDWQFPILQTTRLNAPEGVSIAFTDSIPLLAVPFKLLRGWLPPDFHYFGLWHLLVFALQGVAGAFLVRSLNCRQWYAALAGAALALMSPVLAWRLGHSSLMAHALVLFALGAYFRGIAGSWSSRRATLALALTALTGLLIHPYWLALCSGLFVAFLWDDARTQGHWRPQVMRLALLLASVAVLLKVFGYGGSSLGASGFGLYSMNLVAPFCGGRLTPCYTDATGGQYEGFNYLGGGVLLLALVALPFWARDWRQWSSRLWTRHLGLLCCMVAFSLYALSNEVYLGSHQVLSIPLPDVLIRITSVFRASGRFFWVVGYLIAFAVLAYWLRDRSPRLALPLLAIALPLQWWDVQPAWDRLAQRAAEPSRHELLPWRPLLAGVHQINLHPAFGCQEGDVADHFFFQRLAAWSGMTMDNGYIARAAQDCAAKARKFGLAFQPGQLYVLAAPYFHYPVTDLPQGFQSALGARACAQWERTLICKAGMTRAAWEALPLRVTPLAGAGPALVSEWPAADLSTQIGTVTDGVLRPADRTAQGYLSFGPYAKLGSGRYGVRLEYRSSLPVSANAGAWDAVAAPLDGGQGKVYASGTIAGTHGADGAIELTIDRADQDGPLEVRTVYPGRGDLAIVRLVVSAPSSGAAGDQQDSAEDEHHAGDAAETK